MKIDDCEMCGLPRTICDGRRREIRNMIMERSKQPGFEGTIGQLSNLNWIEISKTYDFYKKERNRNGVPKCIDNEIMALIPCRTRKYHYQYFSLFLSKEKTTKIRFHLNVDNKDMHHVSMFVKNGNYHVPMGAWVGLTEDDRCVGVLESPFDLHCNYAITDENILLD